MDKDIATFFSLFLKFFIKNIKLKQIVQFKSPPQLLRAL